MSEYLADGDRQLYGVRPMTNKLMLDLTTRPVTPCDLDELENIARTHENLAYRYRSAVSLMRLKLKREEERRLQLLQSETDNA